MRTMWCASRILEDSSGLRQCGAPGTDLVSRRQDFRLEFFHAASVNIQIAFAGLDTEHLDTGRFVLVTLPKCNGHLSRPLLQLLERRVAAAQFTLVRSAGHDELRVTVRAPVALTSHCCHITPV